MDLIVSARTVSHWSRLVYDFYFPAKPQQGFKNAIERARKQKIQRQIQTDTKHRHRTQTQKETKESKKERKREGKKETQKAKKIEQIERE